jgi:serine/threonine protein kinase
MKGESMKDVINPTQMTVKQRQRVGGFLAQQQLPGIAHKLDEKRDFDLTHAITITLDSSGRRHYKVLGNDNKKNKADITFSDGNLVPKRQLKGEGSQAKAYVAIGKLIGDSAENPISYYEYTAAKQRLFRGEKLGQLEAKKQSDENSETPQEETGSVIIKTAAEEPTGSIVIKDVFARQHLAHEIELSKKIPHLDIQAAFETQNSKGQTVFYTDGQLFPGYSLQEILDVLEKKKIRLTELQFLALAYPLWVALQTQVHLHNIIHQDIKPENMMVAGEFIDFLMEEATNLPDNNSNWTTIKWPAADQPLKLPVINIIDFGLAKKSENDEIADKLRINRLVVGTLLYAAPEVCQLENSTEAADIYGAAVLTAELGNTPISLSKLEKLEKLEKLKIWLYKSQRQPSDNCPPPISANNLFFDNPELKKNDAIKNAVLKGLEFYPKNRPRLEDLISVFGKELLLAQLENANNLYKLESLNKLYKILKLDSKNFNILQETVDLIDTLNSNQTPEQKIKAIQDYKQKMLPLQAVATDLWEATEKIAFTGGGFLLISIVAGILSLTCLPALPLVIAAVAAAISIALLITTVVWGTYSFAASAYAFFKATPLDDAIEEVALDLKRNIPKQVTAVEPKPIANALPH